MKLRLHGTALECERAIARLAEVFTVVSVSGAYPTGRQAYWSASTSTSASELTT